MYATKYQFLPPSFLTMVMNKIRKVIGNTIPKKTLQQRYPYYKFGKGTYSKDLHVFSWGEGSSLEIGAFCSIAEGVKIFLGGEHRVDWVTTYPFSALWESASSFTGHPKSKGDVIIGNDVWIGTEAVIMSGVRIGDGAVISARALVARDVPPYSIVVGNPARIIKKRFDDEIINRLLFVKWWEWDNKVIDEHMHLLLTDDIEEFLAKAEQLVLLI